MNRNDYLFADNDLDGILRQNLQNRVGPEIDKISKDQLLSVPKEDIIEHVFAELSASPIELHEDRMESSESETKIDVSGDPNRYFSRDRGGPFYAPAHQITIDVPFSGDHQLWTMKPNSWKSVFPRGQITPGRRADALGNLRLVYTVPVDNLNEESLKNEIQRDLELIRFYVGGSASQVEAYNAQLKQAIESAIDARKERISKTEGLASRIGLQVRRNPNAPDPVPINLKRKIVRPLPTVSAGSFEPEYGIEDATYEHILNVIRHEIATFESTPVTYANLGEEDLRNILLAHLNGHYEGDATGETFRHRGKTDIRIEADNRAAFVGECKVWTGVAGLSSAIDQLIGYLTWRDCKASLVVFNKKVKDFSSILSKCPEQLRAHGAFKREVKEHASANEWRVCLRSPVDEGREIMVHAFLANLFVS